MKALSRLTVLLLAISFFFTACEETTDILNPTDERSNYTGIWNVVETSETFSTQYYEVEFFALSADSSILTIANFFGLGSEYEVEVELNDDIMLLPLQTLGGYQFLGQGQISADKKTINFSYTTEEVATTKSVHSEEVTAVFTKQ